jgi:N-succinyl-L-ornithine transcarbamylase
MKNFTSVNDVDDIEKAVHTALEIKADPYCSSALGKNKTLGLIFLNPSLRTRLSTQKAGMNLGMKVMVMNAGQESWTWELEDDVVMNGNSVEHIKDAARVISQYCDIIGLRCFPALKNRQEDYSEQVLNKFIQHCRVPVISLESATLHPLQSFADLITIKEQWKKKRKPKIVLTWAPHIKPLPQAVANSFAQWMLKAGMDLTIAQPEGYELSEEFTHGATISYQQKDALENADFIYVKSWSSYNQYGEMPAVHSDWLLKEELLLNNNEAKFMHCLPVRRNLELKNEIIDSKNSLVYEQAFNRTIAGQTILKTMLEMN